MTGDAHSLSRSNDPDRMSATDLNAVFGRTRRCIAANREEGDSCDFGSYRAAESPNLAVFQKKFLTGLLPSDLTLQVPKWRLLPPMLKRKSAMSDHDARADNADSIDTNSTSRLLSMFVHR